MIINIDEILGNTMIFNIDDQQAVDEFLEYIKEENVLPPNLNEEVWSDGNIYIISEEFRTQIFKPKKSGNYSNHLIFGKDETEELVSIEVKDDNIWLFFNDGRIETRPMIYWFLTNSQYSNTTKLKGNLYYQFIKEYNSLEKFQKDRGYMKFQKKADIYTVWDNNESAMVYNGLTLFKGLKVDDVSRLHFDIETNGLVKDQSSKVYIITNTFKHRDQIIKKVFSIDNYNNDDTLMIKDWVKWVQEINPTIINGHNILGFDFPYLSWCYGQRDGIDRDLELGRDCSEITYNKKPSKFRVDGSQDWTYHNINIFGRHIIDGAFLSVKYDFSRKYPSWKLKEIIEYEYKELLKKKKKDLTKNELDFIKRQETRQFYDAGTIRNKWDNLEERKKIIDYCRDDSDDSAYLFELQISSYFYYCQSVPMNFQSINNSATGRQINLCLVRAYLQDGYSIPKPNGYTKFGGGISFGIPGLFKNVFKVDVASLYPSIILTYNIWDKSKDPEGYFYKMVSYFTEERLKNKKLGKETGDRFFKDVEQSQKIFINSSYGMLGTQGLNFNSFENADFITSKGREILKKSILWATGKQYSYWYNKFLDKTEGDLKDYIDLSDVSLPENIKPYDFIIGPCDTDSISFLKPKGKPFSEDERNALINELNSIMDSGIRFEDDGYFKSVLIIKAKNYVLSDGKDHKIKGSALKATMKEPALKEFIDKLIDYMINDKFDRISSLYHIYVREILDIKDISRWGMKKSITKSVLGATNDDSRLQEKKILETIQNEDDIQEGDKIYLYYTPNEDLKRIEDFDGEYSQKVYLNKLYKTLDIFSNVIDIKLIPDYTLVRNKDLLTLI